MWIFDPGSGVFLGHFLRLIAVAYFFGGLVHLGNLLGFGNIPSSEAPIGFLILDVVYLTLDALVVVGAWRRTSWGVACFFLAATSQLVLYVGFPTLIASTAEDLANIRGLVGFNLVALGAYLTLRLFKW